MRVRTAVGLASAIVVAKGALTAIALVAWVSIPGRRWLANPWHVELGPLAEWLAAGAAAGAAIVALVIATLDRQHQIKDRRDEERTQARLVRLSVQGLSGRPVVVVKVRNFGRLPVLDVTLVGAAWNEHPTARWGTKGLVREELVKPILRPHQSDSPYEEMIDFEIWFMHPTEDKTLVPVVREFHGGYRVYAQIDFSKVVVKIQFTTANGVRWETPTKGADTGEPVRLS
jgi:hypothetical protein